MLKYVKNDYYYSIINIIYNKIIYKNYVKFLGLT